VCPPDPNASPCAPPLAGGATLPGGTLIAFNLSQAIQPSFPSGQVVGGTAFGTIDFDARIDPLFAFGPHSSVDVDQAVDKDDPLLSHAVITGMVVSKSAPKCGDDSTFCLVVPGDKVKKEVVAKNGVYLGSIPDPIGVSTPLTQFTRDDLITYRITKVIPS